jgi:Dyp-type peroxidase family
MTNLNQTAIDPRVSTFNDLFSNLQGNILKGHGRNHTNHIFLKFHSSETAIKKAKKWIHEFADSQITSCEKQLKETELFKRNKVSGGTFFNLYLSAEGYNIFGYDVSKFEDDSFKAGMKASKFKLNDPDKSKWESGFRDNAHAMILIADPDVNTLSEVAKVILEDVAKFARVLNIEYGNAIRNANGDGLEHFGYVDGVSQPLFFKEEMDDYNSENLQPLNFDPTAELDLVLVNDPFVQGHDAYGSYFVFRKLEQHVKGFKTAEKKLAHQLDLKGEDKERAGAMIVGRFEDGTPITLSKDAGLIGSGTLNNFNYDEDKKGAKCPFHAHIRKSNPRSHPSDKKRIMARRGITYGHRNVNTEVDPLLIQMPEGGVGLLFMSFQKSIINQYEFIQSQWVNNPHFPNDNNGIDPIIGQDGDKNISEGAFPIIFDSDSKVNMKTKSFNNFVTLKGGEYFFAPSIPFLKKI